MEVIETFVLSKTGDKESSEDAIVISDSFCGVIDGATNKTEFTIQGRSPGHVAAHLIQSEVRHLPADIGASDAIKHLNQTIASFLAENGLSEQLFRHPEFRATASLVLYSEQHNQIWMVGDCQCSVDGKVYHNTKKVDELLSDIRAFVLEHEIICGRTIEDLQKHDVGRECILPLLNRQYSFQNHNFDSDFSYAALDGFGRPEEKVRVIDIGQKCTSIILASDGYPVLRSTLEESERILNRILEDDPLLISSYRSTKGLTEGLVSFDDRAYIRIIPDDN